MKCVGTTYTKEYEYNDTIVMLKHKDEMVTDGWIVVAWNTVKRVAIYVKNEER